MIRALLLRALTVLALGAAIGIIYLAVLDALVAPAVGLALIAAVLLFACFVVTAPLARRRLRRRPWDAHKRATLVMPARRQRRDAHRRDMQELDRALGEFERDQAHNRLGL